MELGWGGFDRAKLDMLMLIMIPFSFHECTVYYVIGQIKTSKRMLACS